MPNHESQDALRKELARRSATRPEDWFLTVKARHGMLVVFRELRGRRGEGAVLTQLLTCCTAVNPIVSAGLVPVYGDVSPLTLALDPEGLPGVENLRAIVSQNSFGYIDAGSARALRDRAHDQGAILVEDCAHCVGRMAVDEDGRPLADVSIHSFGVEKMLPTYFGGAVWLNPEMADVHLRQAIAATLEALPEPDGHLARTMKSYRNQVRVLNHLPGGLSRATRRFLTSSGSFEAAIQPEEQRGGVAHEPSLPGEYVAARALDGLRGLDASEAQRQSALEAFAQRLAGMTGVRISPAILASGQPLLRLPLNLVSNEAADAAIAAIASLGLYAVPWYRHLLFPGVTDAVAYHVDASLLEGEGGKSRSSEGLVQTLGLTQGALAVPCDLSGEQVNAVCDALDAVARSGGAGRS